MSYEINPNRNQTFLFPLSVEDFLQDNHPARFINEFVDSIDMIESGFRTRKNDNGRPSYSGKLLLKVWLYAYFNKVRSTRDIERMCHNDVGMLWLTGLNYPDHNTIWRFFRDNRKSLKKVFKKSAIVAMDLSMVNLILTAVDGTKILADVSKKSIVSRKDLEKKLDSIIDEKFDEIEKNHSDNDDDNSYLMPDNHSDTKELRNKIKEKLENLDNKKKRYHSDTDPDSNMMRLSDNSKKMGYNAQSIVDSECGIIIGELVSTDQSDNELLTPVIEKAIDTVEVTPKTIVADAGYYSGHQIDLAEGLDSDVLVCDTRTYSERHNGNPDWEFHQSKFVYDDISDTYTCPTGDILTFRGTQKYKSKGRFSKLYRCQNYRNCSMANECSKANRPRTLTIAPFQEARARMFDKMQDPVNKQLMSRRKVIVEPIFGIIKHILGFRRFTVRGLENVGTQWSLVCTSLNLRKIYKNWAVTA